MATSALPASAAVVVVGKPVALDGTLQRGPATSSVSLPPAAQQFAVSAALEPYQQRLCMYLADVRPWQEFALLSKPSGSTDLRERLTANLVHFQPNYLLVLLACVVIAVVQSTFCIVTACLLSAGWMVYLEKDQDDSVSWNVASWRLGRPQRRSALAVLTALAFLASAGEPIVHAVLIGSTLVAAHGALHPVPDPQASDDDVEQARCQTSGICSDPPL